MEPRTTFRHQKALKLIAQCAAKDLPAPPNKLLKRRYLRDLIGRGWVKVHVYPKQYRQLEIVHGRWAGLKTQKPPGEMIRTIDRETSAGFEYRKIVPTSNSHPHHCEIFGGFDDAEASRRSRNG